MGRGVRTMTMISSALISVVSISRLRTTVVSAFTRVSSAPSFSSVGKSLLRLDECSAPESTFPVDPTSTHPEGQGEEAEECWASHALLFSSLNDGVIPNDGARTFLQYSLAKTLLCESITQKEDKLRSSVEFSPCNGPNMEDLNTLESVDELLDRGEKLLTRRDFNDKEEANSWADESMRRLISDAKSDINVRILYIPTAFYALNPQSSSTPGKQRQRARADGKKRRTQLLKLLDDLLPQIEDIVPQFNLIATTLDLDDGSLKQPVGSDDASVFPHDGKSALSTWQPHLIYVEGGNTFWLQHCIEKGGYAALMRDACTGPSGAIYCGKSAGAIIAGSSVATATWKGWDDPSVVPGKQSYDDWLDCPGFGFVGDRSFFPHMSDDWIDLIKEKSDAQTSELSLSCLREEDAFCVVGGKKLCFVVSGPSPIDTT
ncbi:hypothetical protein ACHAWF_004063 [Thalassiosira exigua]